MINTHTPASKREFPAVLDHRTALPLVLLATAFVVDLTVPLGVAVGVLYVLPLLATLRFRIERLTKWITVLASLLTLIGWALSPDGGEAFKVAANRILSLLAIIVTYAVLRNAIVAFTLSEARNKQFHTLFESSPYAKVLVKNDGTIILVNRTLLTLFQYRPEELFEQSITMLFEDQDSEFLYFSCLGIHSTVTKEFSALRKDKTTIKIECTFTSITMDQEEVSLLSIRDLSDLLKAEKRFSQVVEAAPCGMVMVDQQGIIVLANAMIYEQFGYPRDTLLGQSIETLIPERFRGQHSDYRTNYSDSPTSRMLGKRRQLEALHRDGSEFPVEIGLNPLDSEEGNFVLASVVDISERIEVQERLMQSETHSRLILQSAGEGIYGLNMEGCTTFVNPAAATMLGYAPEELLGAQMHSTVHHTRTDGSPHPQEECPMYSTFLDGSVRNIQNDILWRKDGTSFPVEYTSHPIRDKKGTIEGAVVTFRDITDRLAMDKALRTSVKERQVILDNVPALIASFDREHRYRFANTRYLEWFNISLENLIGRHAKELLTEEVYDGLIKNRMNQALAGAIVTYQLKVPHADGAMRWVEATYVPDADDRGDIHGFFAMIIDIHQRKLYEEEIQQLTERLQLATQSAKIGVWDWDVVNNVLTWDAQMYALYGISSDTFTGAYEAWVAALHPEDHDQAQEELHDAMEGKTPFDTSFRILWPNRSTRYIRAFAHVNRNVAGDAVRMTGVNWDITDEKISELALTESIEDLRRSNAELEQFAYVASHDLQEPLRKIRNYSELLEHRFKAQLPPEAHKFLNPIVDGAARMQGLVQDLLAYSRVARGQLALETTSLQDIADNVYTTLETMIAEHQATVTIGTLPTIEANPLLMGQLFQNLIVNGLKYNRSTTPTIEISATAKGAYWEFAIRDNGIGIDPQYNDRIFVIFQRLHTQKEFSGTGIGLSICRKIVELHSGQIWVDSKEGEGSTFFFTLPNLQVVNR